MELSEHKFIKKLVSDLTFNHRNNINQSESIYCIQVKKDLDKVKKILMDLMMIRQLIAELHPKSGIQTNSIIQPESLLKYHIENYFLRIMTYKDLVMNLIATIYGWEIKSGIGYEKRLINKANEEGVFEINISVDKMTSLLSSVRETRNKLAHEGALDDVDINLLEVQRGIANIMDDYPILNHKKENHFDLDLYSTYFALTVMNNLQEMMQIEEDMATNLFENLDFIYQYYTQVVPYKHPQSN